MITKRCYTAYIFCGIIENSAHTGLTRSAAYDNEHGWLEGHGYRGESKLGRKYEGVSCVYTRVNSWFYGCNYVCGCI